MLQINLEKLDNIDFFGNEAYISLRTNIQFFGKDVKLICVTSCLPNEGKSYVSFNLAKSMADNGKRVLFIDADLRKSVIVGRYKPNHSVNGLTHYLSGQLMLSDVLYETNIENLDIIFSGAVPPNPADLLGNDCFKELLRALRKVYDYVIIDTPPLGSVVDSAIVAENCDGVIFVIKSNSISYKFAMKVIKQLNKGQIKILGAVLNKYDYEGKQYGNYGYYRRKYKEYRSYYTRTEETDKVSSIADEMEDL